MSQRAYRVGVRLPKTFRTALSRSGELCRSPVEPVAYILNGVLERYWSMREAAPLLGVSERQGWRLLAAYRKDAFTFNETGTFRYYCKFHGDNGDVGMAGTIIVQ